MHFCFQGKGVSQLVWEKIYMNHFPLQLNS